MNLIDNIINEEELSDVKTSHHTPEGLFTGATKDIVDGLLKDANGDEELALKRINYYINRAGDGLSNKTAVHNAKKELEKKIEEKKEALQNSKFINEVRNILTEIEVGDDKYMSRVAHISATHPNEPSTVTYNKSTDVITHANQPKVVEDYAQDKFGIPPFCWDSKFSFVSPRFGMNNPIRLVGIMNLKGLGRKTDRPDVLVVNYALNKDQDIDEYDFKTNQNRLYNQYMTVAEFKDCFNPEKDNIYTQTNGKIIANWLTNIKNARKSRYKAMLDPDRVSKERDAKNQAFTVFKDYYKQLWQGTDFNTLQPILAFMSTHEPEKWNVKLQDYLDRLPEGHAAQMQYTKTILNDLIASIKEYVDAKDTKKTKVDKDHVIDLSGDEDE